MSCTLSVFVSGYNFNFCSNVHALLGETLFVLCLSVLINLCKKFTFIFSSHSLLPYFALYIVVEHKGTKCLHSDISSL